MAAYNDGRGVAIVGTWSWDYLNGSFSADGVPNAAHYGSVGNEFAGYTELHVVRGGVISFYEMTSRTCTGLPYMCYYYCNTAEPSGIGWPMMYLTGRNDAGQIAGVSPANYNHCSPVGYGTIWASNNLMRASSAGVTEVSTTTTSGIQLPIILGPNGEFHWGGTGFSITKTDVSGVVAWTKTPTISGSIASSAWDVDAAGNIQIALSFSGTVNYGGGYLTATGPRDLGLIKLDPAGNVLWQKHFGASGFTMGNVQLSRTGTGDMTVSGDHAGVIDFGTGSLSGGKFVVKFNASGIAVWDVDILSARTLWVAGDLSGAVYVGVPRINLDGNYNNTDFGWGLVNEFFIAKYQ
jgi:hypothetical protein